MPASRRLRSWPEGPTNGSPCRSSWKPGASPTSISSACGSPWPKTTWVRLSWRRQRVQVAASSAIRSSSVGIVTSPSSRTDADHPVVQGGGQVRPPEAWRARRNHTVRSVDGYRGDAYAPRRQVVGLRRGRGDLLKRVRRVSLLLLAGLVL